MFCSKKLVIIAVALISGALLAAACGSDPTPQPTAVPQPQPTAIPAAIPTATTVPTEPAPTATRRPPPAISFPTATPTIETAPIPTPEPAPTATPVPEPTPDLIALSGQTPPQIFIGTATIDGAPAPDGTVVTAFIDGVAVASAVVNGGAYPVLQIPNPGSEVTFKLGDLVADQTATTYQGGADIVNLTASSS